STIGELSAFLSRENQAAQAATAQAAQAATTQASPVKAA
ncbi:MAG: hypothetical protein JWO34_996, partial [Arthrobacter sp.]|nr:hypothetical protein [Arthrobacter sp.]